MKTKEFIKAVKNLGFTIKYYKNPFSNIKSNCDYDLITISANNQVLVKVSTNCQYAISTISDGHSSCLSGYDVDKLYKLCFEYASTPVEDREEEEKFYLKHRWLMTEFGDTYYLCKCYNAAGKISYGVRLSYITHDETWLFTLKEIEEIKEKFDTDLSDYELVKVKDEKV